MVSTLTDMARLAMRRPALAASAEEVAAWYVAKGRLHERLAEQAGANVAEAAAELAHAAAAYEHARRLGVAR